MIFHEGSLAKMIPMWYLVFNAHTYPISFLLGRPSLNKLGVVVSTPHLNMKFPLIARDIVTMHEDQKLVTECYIVNLRPPSPALKTNNIKQTLGTETIMVGKDIDP